LPSEAEWEYACRAGTVTVYSCGHSVELLSRYGWYHENAKDVLYPVGMLKPNDFGLFDMHGSVWEWCYESSESRRRFKAASVVSNDDTEDTQPVRNDVGRVTKGGSFFDRPINARTFVRVPIEPWRGSVGIRPVRTLP
jgi:formylglycine-generating enzyme required for sulfatase activity